MTSTLSFNNFPALEDYLNSIAYVAQRQPTIDQDYDDFVFHVQGNPGATTTLLTLTNESIYVTRIGITGDNVGAAVGYSQVRWNPSAGADSVYGDLIVAANSVNHDNWLFNYVAKNVGSGVVECVNSADLTTLVTLWGRYI